MFYDVITTISFLEHNNIRGNELTDLYYALNQGGIHYADLTFSNKTVKWNDNSTCREFIDFFTSLGLKGNTGKKTSFEKGDFYLSKEEKAIFYIIEKCDKNNYSNNSYRIRIDGNETITKDCVIKLSRITNSFKLYDSMILNELYLNGTNLFKKTFLLCSLEAITLQKRITCSFTEQRIEQFKRQRVTNICSRYKDLLNNYFLISYSKQEEIEEITRGSDDEDCDYQRIKSTYSQLINNDEKPDFYKSKENRRIFQNRFTSFYQLFCMVNYKDINEDILSMEEDEIYTLTDAFKKYCQAVIIYVTGNSECRVESIYDLAGYIFDSVTPATNTDTSKLDEEYHKFQSMAKCYGVGGLDYYFALERNKDINHYAAMELANIYFFGSEFDGYKVERDREKCIKLLETCQAYLPNARWSLGENYLRLSEKYERFIKQYQCEELGENPEYIHKKEEFRDYEREDYEKEKESCGSQNFIEFMKDKKEDLRKKRMGLYSACGDYTPAKNSLARDYIALAKEDADHRIEYVKRALSYAKDAALGGWIYGFNNLFELFNNELFEEAREQLKIDFDNARDDVLYNIKPTIKETHLKILDNAKNKMTNLNEGIESYGIKFKYLDNRDDPYNFLIVSAYLGNIWAARRLSWQLVEDPNTFDFAVKLSERVIKYDPSHKDSLSAKIEEYRIKHI